MSTISSGTTLTTALVQTGDTTGDLVIKTGSSNTTALTISGTDQSITVAGGLNLGAPIAVVSGGTGANSAATARTNLGLAIGTDVLAPTGTGTGLTALNGSNVTSGTIATARLATGTANSSTYLRGDQTWAAIASSQWTTTGSDIYYNTGNVGIGTSSPSTKLTVYAGDNSSSDLNALLLINNGENGTNINFNNAFGALAQIKSTKLGGGSSADDGVLAFYTAANSSLAERMKIDSSGNIYVGTDTTCNLLDFRSKSLASSGYQKIAGGLIIQWGSIPSTGANGNVTVTYPITFPNATLNTMLTTNGTANTESFKFQSASTSQGTYRNASGGTTQSGLYLVLGY